MARDLKPTETELPLISNILLSKNRNINTALKKILTGAEIVLGSRRRRSPRTTADSSRIYYIRWLSPERKQLFLPLPTQYQHRLLALLCVKRHGQR